MPLFIYPLGLAIILGIAGLLFGWAGKRAKATLAAMSAITWLWVSYTPVFSDFVPESRLIADLMKELGVPVDALLLETKSRNTHQNAIYSLEIIEEKGIKRILLVTSAFHMKRASAVFEKLGVEVIPAATDYQVPDHEETVLDWLPDAAALARTTVGIKEYLGWFVYQWRGWVK